MYKLLISIFCILIFSCSVLAKTNTFVSVSPSLTEVMYALGAQDSLKAVSTQCSFPEEVKEKPIIGDYYYINGEMLLDIKPDYILAPDSSDFMLARFRHFGAEPLCLKYPDIEAVYNNILTLGKLTNREKRAEELVSEIKNKIDYARSLNKEPNKKILYVISMQPFMTIGGKSFITDIIEKSGNHSITKDIDTFYPAISLEYAINQKPDIVVLDYHCFSKEGIEKYFPEAKIVTMTKDQSDIIDRPATRIYQSVEFFANLDN